MYSCTQLVKSKTLLWKHLIPLIKYSFSRNSYVCLIWTFIFDTDQAQIYSVQYRRRVGLLETVTLYKKLFDIPVPSRDVMYQTLPGRE